MSKIKIVKHEENKNISKYKLSLFNIIVFPIVIILNILKQLYIGDIDLLFLDNISKNTNVIISITTIVIWLIIIVICGIHQSKVENTSTKVFTVLKEENNRKNKMSKKEKIIEEVGSCITAINMWLTAMLLNFSVGVIIAIISAILTVSLSLSNKFKLCDYAFTIFTIGAISVIYYSFK